MNHRLLHRIGLATMLTLLVASPALAGCVQVQVTDLPVEAATPTPYGELTSSREAHDLAILGIEFNPPLKAQDVIASGKITLLVAVENRGMSAENPVKLDARLVGAGETEVLLENSQTLDSIAPGEVKLIRFDNLVIVPYRTAYIMTVTVSPAPGETRLADNQRSYRLQLSVPGSASPAVTPTGAALP
jgi:hypothetical protein